MYLVKDAHGMVFTILENFSGTDVMKNATLHLIFICVQYHGLLEMFC